MLKFIGSGSAFNTKLGNNSAYYKEGDQLFIIDCGSNIFHRIKESSLLEGVKEVHVMVTHTHADHIGSLADLILYTFFSHGEMVKIKTTVYAFNATRTKEILKDMGAIDDKHYYFQPLRYTIELKLNGFNDLTICDYYQTSHVQELFSFGFLLNINNQKIYYSGDASSISEEVLRKIELNEIDFAYVDTCKADYEGNVHLSLRKLTNLIPPEYRKKVWCMHIDEAFDREEAEELGFNVVKNEM